MERLVNERSILLGYSIDASSFEAYTSALNSYITFCNLHELPIDPTPDTLSFYIVFLSTYIKPDSVNSYLSGICRQLEPFYPDVRNNRKSLLVSRTMTGCMRRFGTPVHRKSPLSHANLLFILDSIVSEPTHDELLFATLVLTGFHGLLRLGELTFPDKKSLRNWRKITLRLSVSIAPMRHYSFFLPSHKGDPFFEGNTILIQKNQTPTDSYQPFIAYLQSRDRLFPLHPELWLTSKGRIPTCHWFISDSVLSSPKRSPENPLDLEALLPWLKLELVSTPSKQLVVGLRELFGSTSVKILSYFTHSFSGAPRINHSIRLIVDFLSCSLHHFFHLLPLFFSFSNLFYFFFEIYLSYKPL
jgi:hypothetical protein